MRISRLSVLLITLMMLSAAALPAYAHFEWEITDTNMSILVQGVTLDDEQMVAGDEVGVFTQDGLCAGGDVLGADGRCGPMAMGAEAEQDNGFQDREPLSFRVWDADADIEAPAVVSRLVQGNAIWSNNGFVILFLSAETPPPVPVIWVSADAHDFGVIRAGQSAEWNFTVRNDGGEDLNVESINLEGDNFSVNFEEAFTLEPDAEAEFTVTFSSDQEDEGEFNGTITIVSDDPDGDVQIALTGVVQAAIPPTIVLSRNNFAFGGVLVGELSTRTLTISNIGDEALTIEDVVLESDAFSVNFEEAFDLEFEESANLTITFEPPEFQQYAAEITITSNDQDSPSIVTLSGEGLDPENAGIISLEEVDIKEIEGENFNYTPFFGYVVTRQQKTLRWTLLNNGGRDILIDRIVIDEEDFTASLRPGGNRIRRGDRSYLDVTFAPRRDDFYEDVRMTIFSNDPVNAEYVLYLGGESGANLGVHFHCSRTDINHSVFARTLTLDGQPLVRNDEVGAYTQAGLLAGSGVVTAQGNCGLVLFGDGADTRITDGFTHEEPFRLVVWDASAGIEAPAAYRVIAGPDVYNTNGFTVSDLTAQTGEPEPDFYVRRASYYFGQVDCNGGSADWVFRIENHGVGTLTIENIESDNGAFTTDFRDPVDIGERGVLDVTVTFTPDQVAEYTGRLTIASNDPDDNPYYIDVTGDGAENPQNPGVEFGEGIENHFFGVRHLNSRTSYVLEINSVGGARLDVTEIGFQGDQVFTSNWDGQNHVVNPGETYELTISFTPDAVRQFNGMFTVTTNADEEPREFAVRGYGSDAADHFLELNTGASHSIRVTQSRIITRQGNETPLYPGDEIGVFTADELCAGHGRCAAARDTIIITAYANDPNNNFADGFIAGERFTFKIWDRSTRDELDCRVQYIGNGPQVFTVGGNTEINVQSDAIHEEGMMSVEPAVLQMGAVRVGQRTTGVFRMTNIGGANLTVQSVQSNRQVFTTDFANPVVIEPGAFTDLTVTFAPAATLPYEGILTINSNDPHRPAYQVRPCGMGSDVPNNAHFVYGRSDANQQVLIRAIDIAGQPPSIGDEIGLFTQSGLCAGAVVIANPRVQQGLSAWGDENESLLVEGFANNEPMTLRYYHFGLNRENDQIEIDLQEGTMNYRTNNMTVIRLMTVAFEGVRFIPVDPFTVREKQNVDFTLRLVNAEQNYDIVFDNRANYQRIPDNALAVEDNVGTFHWRTDSLSQGVYDLIFSVREGEEVLNRTTVHFTVQNVNEPPSLYYLYLDSLINLGVVNGHQWRMEDDVLVFDVPQHAGNNPLWVQVFNLRRLLPDVDGQQLVFYYNTNQNQIPPAQIRQQKDNNDIYSISPMNNWAGRNEFFWVTANDQQGEGRDDGRDLGIRDVRSLRSSAYPLRDDTTHFNFVVNVIDVPDQPVITVPAAGNRNVTVRERCDVNPPGNPNPLVVNFTATDADADDQLTWRADITNQLPEGWQFVDNRNRTATFTWIPTYNDYRQAVYAPVFEVSDGITDPVTVTINITVQNYNRNPIIDAPAANERFDVDENADLQIVFRAHDLDIRPQADVLRWTLTNRGGLPAAGPALQDHGDGTATFTWRPGFTHSGNYNPTFTVTDNGPGFNANATATVQIQIVVTNVNRPPRAGNQPADTTWNEDEGPWNVALAGTVVDDDGDAITYTLMENPPADMGLSINGSTLTVAPVPNFNTADEQGVAQFVPITYFGADPSGEDPVERTVNIKINPVNDPPAAFNLLTPENNFAIAYLDSANAVNFTWEEAVQNQWEIDSVRYTLVLWEESNPNLTLRITGIEETSYQNPAYSPIAIADSLDLWLGAPFWFSWRIEAIDRSVAGLTAANAPFRFQIPQLGITDEKLGAIPDHFFLSGNFPNPFNSETTVQYGLPVPANVSLTVWDMHGRKVADLQRSQMAPGQYEAVWNATGLTSGIYFIRLQANGFTTMNKAILVR